MLLIAVYISYNKVPCFSNKFLLNKFFNIFNAAIFISIKGEDNNLAKIYEDN